MCPRKEFPVVANVPSGNGWGRERSLAALSAFLDLLHALERGRCAAVEEAIRQLRAEGVEVKAVWRPDSEEEGGVRHA